MREATGDRGHGEAGRIEQAEPAARPASGAAEPVVPGSKDLAVLQEAPSSRGAELAAQRAPAARPDGSCEAPPRHRAAWPDGVPAAELARYYLPDGQGVLPGNSCRLLRDGVEAYPAMLDAIRGAQRFIRLETYMFISDPVGEEFARALMDAARRGVHVKVVYDALGSWTSRSEFFAEMRSVGVDIRPFKPFSLQRGLRYMVQRDHRKILVVDGEVAFTGGVNISAAWAPLGQGDNWRDDVLRIEGPAVHELERRFVATWRMAFQERFRTWMRRHRQSSLPRRARGDTALAVLSSRRSIHRAYLHAIERARVSVLVAAAYFVPDRQMVKALRDAATRGVEVSLILNGKSDHPILEWCTRAFYTRMLEVGVRVFEWQRGVLHAKTAVVDGVWGTVGSFNLERLSLRFNHEVNVAFADGHLGAALEESFRTDCKACHEVTLAAHEARPFWHRVLERFVYFFRKLI